MYDETAILVQVELSENQPEQIIGDGRVVPSNTTCNHQQTIQLLGNPINLPKNPLNWKTLKIPIL